MNLTTHRGEAYEYLETEKNVRLFSVTQVRKTAHDHYATIPPERLEPARVRGSILHRRFFFVLAARGGLRPMPPVLTQYPGYCKSMDDWAVKNMVWPVKLEYKGANLKLGYAGQLDAQILYGPKSLLTLMDLKTGEETLTDPMQLVAYDHIPDLKSRALLDLYLDAEGGPARERWIKPGEQGVHWAVFLNALSLLKWRTSHGRQ